MEEKLGKFKENGYYIIVIYEGQKTFVFRYAFNDVDILKAVEFAIKDYFIVSPCGIADKIVIQKDVNV